MNNKLVLIGVTGRKSGGALATHISDHLDEVLQMFPSGITVICRSTSNTERIEKLLPSVTIKRGELTDSKFLVEAFKEADTVIHVAGIHWSRYVVDAAIADNVRRLILVHTTGIYSKYKVAGEEYRHIDEYVDAKCRENNIVFTILRPTMIYGNTSDNNVVTFIKMVDKLPLMPVVRGARFELQPVHYEDLGKAYFDVLMNEKATAGKNYDLSGGEEIQLRDMLSVIGDDLGKKVRFISCPYWLAYSGAWFIYCLTLTKVDYRERVQRLCEPRCYSHKQATADFGYNPMTFREGIVGEVEEYKKGNKK